MNATDELKPYFEKFNQTSEKASGEALELILLSWLVDLAESGQSRAKDDPSLNWLSDTGLLDALDNAHIEVSAVPRMSMLNQISFWNRRSEQSASCGELIEVAGSGAVKLFPGILSRGAAHGAHAQEQ